MKQSCAAAKHDTRTSCLGLRRPRTQTADRCQHAPGHPQSCIMHRSLAAWRQGYGYKVRTSFLLAVSLSHAICVCISSPSPVPWLLHAWWVSPSSEARNTLTDNARTPERYTRMPAIGGSRKRSRGTTTQVSAYNTRSRSTVCRHGLAARWNAARGLELHPREGPQSR